MELSCFSRPCCLSKDKIKYLYDKKSKEIIGYYFNQGAKLLPSTQKDDLLIKSMDILSFADIGNSIRNLTFLGSVNVPELEFSSVIAAGRYLDMYTKKAEKYEDKKRFKVLFDSYKNQAEKMASVFNSKVKSLVDLIQVK